MANEQRGLHIGLADFAEPTLLLLGQAADFIWLAAELSSRGPFVLQSSSCNPLVSLSLVPVDQVGGLARQGQAFEWRITKSEAQTAAGQLQELAASERPVHAYLDPMMNSTEVQIVASYGEYEPEAVFRSP